MPFNINSKDYATNLRRRWVFGAKDWLAGHNGSLQNLKQVFQYSDNEWEYIWSTMMEDRAWSVPAVTDSFGGFLKENYAPEMMIRFIAHDLKSHIIIFDLQLGSTQFCSANYLKKGNLSYENPIVLYYTGTHFQTVVPKDRSQFIRMALQLEAENDGQTKSSQSIDPVPSIEAKLTDTNKDSTKAETLTLENLRLMKSKTPSQKKLYDKLRKQAQRNNMTQSEKEIQRESARIRMSNRRALRDQEPKDMGSDLNMQKVRIEQILPAKKVEPL